jgi:hypothetical protein
MNKQQRLNHLLSVNRLRFPSFMVNSFDLRDERARWVKWQPGYPAGDVKPKEMIEICDLFIALGYDNKKAFIKWYEITRERIGAKSAYDHMPKPERKDNKDVRVGSGGGSSSSIRYPKKVRKTAWKRFHKLFPNLKNS